jgi:hypothetical protein
MRSDVQNSHQTSNLDRSVRLAMTSFLPSGQIIGPAAVPEAPPSRSSKSPTNPLHQSPYGVPAYPGQGAFPQNGPFFLPEGAPLPQPPAGYICQPYNSPGLPTPQHAPQWADTNAALAQAQAIGTAELLDRARQAATAKTSPGNRRAGTPSSRRPWTTEEEKALMAGLDRVKGPHWSQILALYGPNGTVNDTLKDRNQVQLKDKARNLKLFFLKSGIEVPYYLQFVTGELKTRAPSQARAHQREEQARNAANAQNTPDSGVKTERRDVPMTSIEERPAAPVAPIAQMNMAALNGHPSHHPSHPPQQHQSMVATLPTTMSYPPPPVTHEEILQNAYATHTPRATDTDSHGERRLSDDYAADAAAAAARAIFSMVGMGNTPTPGQTTGAEAKGVDANIDPALGGS